MRFFRGISDESAVILNGVLPNSNIAFSAPVEFSSRNSGVFIEGNLEQLRILHGPLLDLLKRTVKDALFGEWVGLSPANEENPRMIFHYTAAEKIDKIRILSAVLPSHLARFCNLCLTPFSKITVKIGGRIACEQYVVWPPYFTSGKILFSEPSGKIVPIR
ncbi:MAG: hypothetical protein PHQ47_00710 [Candidatus Portnoybacteria bacterium]|nr:hypothetical protein [Candidatus Portnoybacteria bacterium]